MDAAAPPGITFWLLLLFIWLVCHESHPGLVVVVIIILLLIVLIIGVAVGRWFPPMHFNATSTIF